MAQSDAPPQLLPLTLERLGPAHKSIKNHPKSPDIGLLSIIWFLEQDLGTHVARCPAERRQLVIPTFGSKPKVNQTNLVLLADEDVSELDVSMSDAVVMKIEKTACELLEDDRCFSLTNPVAWSAVKVLIKRFFASSVHDQMNLKKLEKNWKMALFGKIGLLGPGSW